MARFRMTCSIWLGSAFTRPKSACRFWRISICSPITPRSILAMSATNSVEIQDLKHQQMAATEDEELTCQDTCSLARFVDFREFAL